MIDRLRGWSAVLVFSSVAAVLGVRPAVAQGQSIVFSKLVFAAEADMGEAAITYHLTPSVGGGSVALQMFVHRDDVLDRAEWDPIVPAKADGSPVIVALAPGVESTGSFTVRLKRGVYGAFRLILFRSDDGATINYNKLAYDSTHDPRSASMNLKLTIRTESVRVKKPVLYLPDRIRDVVLDDDGTYSLSIPATVKIPAAYAAGDRGFWVMAKSSAGFSQKWAAMGDALDAGNASDPYKTISVEFSMNGIKSGLYRVEFGLFKEHFGDPLQWIWPGLYFEAGGDRWERRAPASRIPPRLRVRSRRFVEQGGAVHDFYPGLPRARSAVGFIRGGNYGNSIVRNVQPALNDADFFIKLAALGCRFMRVNFNQDRYPGDEVYQHAVDQAVENIWAAGMYPIIGPQGLPEARSPVDQAEKLVRVVEAMARRYRGKSVWIEVCNEPHEFDKWSAWKPIAERCVRAIRAIDPDALVIVPLEGYGKDGRAAAGDPIKSVDVDLYDGHAYVAPKDATRLFGPAVAAGLPLMLGEYGGSAEYLTAMDAAFETLPPGLMALAPWAFTIKGEDSLPLVADGSTSGFALTPAGRAVADDYRRWNLGLKRSKSLSAK